MNTILTERERQPASLPKLPQAEKSVLSAETRIKAFMKKFELSLVIKMEGDVFCVAFFPLVAEDFNRKKHLIARGGTLEESLQQMVDTLQKDRAETLWAFGRGDHPYPIRNIKI